MITAWCIKHEHSELLQNSLVGDCHEVLFFNELGILDIDWCSFPLGLAYTDEPEFRDDWDEDLVLLSEEELSLMDEYGLLVDVGLG